MGDVYSIADLLKVIDRLAVTMPIDQAIDLAIKDLKNNPEFKFLFNLWHQLLIISTDLTDLKEVKEIEIVDKIYEKLNN